MRKITTLNDSYKQKFRISIEGYEAVEVYLEFKPQQQGWFMNLIWGDAFTLNQTRVVVSPNIIRQFANILPFGILINGPNSIDPFDVNAWLNGWEFYILDQDDLTEIEALYVR